MTADSDPLGRHIEAGLARLVSLTDRALLAPTSGSPDRAYWHYRVDKDYPSATFAQAAWPLALLAAGAAPGAPGATLRRRLGAASGQTMRWWAAIQHRDGSFDEWFRFERSHVATAFTTFAIAEAALARRDHFLDSPDHDLVLAALARACRWLAQNHDYAVANHAAGAIAAFASVDALAPGTAAEPLAREIDGLLALMTADGYFPEYGGADPGYSTVTLAFLAHAARRIRDDRLDDALDRLVNFTAEFVHPDGSFGGDYGRRATRYAWLSGFALRAPHDPLAARTLRRLIAGLDRGALAPPTAYDDRYFCFFAYPDLVAARAHIAAAPAPAPATEAAAATSRRFATAGVSVLRSTELHVVVGAKVGGAVRVSRAAAGGELLYEDSGYVGRLASGELVASWRFGAAVELAGDRIRASGDFAFWSRRSPIAEHPILFRLFNRTVGRIPAISAAVTRRAKRMFTAAPRPAPLRLRREVELAGRHLTVRDHIDADVTVEHLCRTAGFAPVHVPSAPLWMPRLEPRLPPTGPNLAPRVRPGEPLEVITTVAIDAAGAATLTVEVDGVRLEPAPVSPA